MWQGPGKRGYRTSEIGPDRVASSEKYQVGFGDAVIPFSTHPNAT
jgi:hypothetical protein